ncbi:MAG: arylsulfatase [Gammaproteobacteria bacterium]|nr:arylsulfatase [Gammaproteobacteria bacterium]
MSLIVRTAGLLLGCLILPAHTAGAAEHEQPNILLLLADDLGYADIGAFGSEIPTPNIDALARNGMLLTNFHSSLTCSPTRSMLMSGTDNHRAGLGVMGAPQRKDQIDQPGYEGYLNFRVASLADLMTDAGYNTYMTGKWHLGTTVETGPIARGFKKAFVSLDGAAHLGNLSWNGPGLAPYRDGTELVEVGPDFYTTQFYTERMIQYIEADRNEHKPFFAYLAYTAPHWPIQAPAESVARFHGKYDAGYRVLYEQRLERLQKLGLVPADIRPTESTTLQAAWDKLTADEQKAEARKMEIYAAMVSDLDFYIGKVIDYLKAIDEFDNTFIIFMSDNGAEASRREIVPPLSDWVKQCCDNSYDNLGRGNSYIMYGPSWARAGSVHLRRSKGTAFEGGIHVPAFVYYPQAVAAGTRSNAFGTVMDLLPTFLDLAGAQHPGSNYRGREILPVTGKSLLPALTGAASEIHTADEYTGWELYGHRAIRQGDWKIVWDPTERDKARWYLFNLAADPGESNDLSERDPDKLAEMIKLWDDYAKTNGVIY